MLAAALLLLLLVTARCCSIQKDHGLAKLTTTAGLENCSRVSFLAIWKQILAASCAAVRTGDPPLSCAKKTRRRSGGGSTSFYVWHVGSTDSSKRHSAGRKARWNRQLTSRLRALLFAVLTVNMAGSEAGSPVSEAPGIPAVGTSSSLSGSSAQWWSPRFGYLPTRDAAASLTVDELEKALTDVK